MRDFRGRFLVLGRGVKYVERRVRFLLFVVLVICRLWDVGGFSRFLVFSVR